MENNRRCEIWSKILFLRPSPSIPAYSKPLSGRHQHSTSTVWLPQDQEKRDGSTAHDLHNSMLFQNIEQSLDLIRLSCQFHHHCLGSRPPFARKMQYPPHRFFFPIGPDLIRASSRLMVILCQIGHLDHIDQFGQLFSARLVRHTTTRVILVTFAFSQRQCCQCYRPGG